MPCRGRMPHAGEEFGVVREPQERRRHRVSVLGSHKPPIDAILDHTLDRKTPGHHDRDAVGKPTANREHRPSGHRTTLRDADGHVDLSPCELGRPDSIIDDQIDVRTSECRVRVAKPLGLRSPARSTGW